MNKLENLKLLVTDACDPTIPRTGFDSRHQLTTPKPSMLMLESHNHAEHSISCKANALVVASYGICYG